MDLFLDTLCEKTLKEWSELPVQPSSFTNGKMACVKKNALKRRIQSAPKGVAIKFNIVERIVRKWISGKKKKYAWNDQMYERARGERLVNFLELTFGNETWIVHRQSSNSYLGIRNFLPKRVNNSQHFHEMRTLMGRWERNLPLPFPFFSRNSLPFQRRLSSSSILLKISSFLALVACSKSMYWPRLIFPATNFSA